MNESGNTRRDFVKKAAYVAPAILTLAAVPSYAKFGSDKLGIESGTDSGIGGISSANGISASRNTSIRSYLNNRGSNGNRVGNSGNGLGNSGNGVGNNGNGLGNNGNGFGSTRNGLGNNGNGLGNNDLGSEGSGNSGITGNAGQNAQSPLHSSALANYRARHGLPSVISPPSD